LEKSHKEEEEDYDDDLKRNSKRSQGRKMRYMGKSSRDDQGPERKSVGTYEELKKEYTKGRSGPSIMKRRSCNLQDGRKQ
jgi:hypothetical protein